jgi:hypothetical protein
MNKAIITMRVISFIEKGNLFEKLASAPIEEITDKELIKKFRESLTTVANKWTDEQIKQIATIIRLDNQGAPSSTVSQQIHEGSVEDKSSANDKEPLETGETEAVKTQLAEIKRIWNSCQNEVDYYGNGDWIQKLDEAINQEYDTSNKTQINTAVNPKLKNMMNSATKL